MASPSERVSVRGLSFKSLAWEVLMLIVQLRFNGWTIVHTKSLLPPPSSSHLPHQSTPPQPSLLSPEPPPPCTALATFTRHHSPCHLHQNHQHNLARRSDGVVLRVLCFLPGLYVFNHYSWTAVRRSSTDLSVYLVPLSLSPFRAVSELWSVTSLNWTPYR